MAVDTRNKRASVIGVAMATALTLPLSDGAVAQADRQHVALCYAGIEAGALVIVTASADVIVKARTDVGTITARPDPGVDAQ